MARNSDPFLVPLSIGMFPESSENGRILGPHFGASEPLRLIFGIAQSWTRSDFQQHAAGELQSVAS